MSACQDCQGNSVRRGEPGTPSEERRLVELARTEAAEAELNRLIVKRSTRETDPDEREELWNESVRAYTARRREEMRTAWCEHHQGQAARLRTTLEFLIARHEEQAAKLMDVPELQRKDF
jgi:hypothetical protein